MEKRYLKCWCRRKQGVYRYTRTFKEMPKYKENKHINMLIPLYGRIAIRPRIEPWEKEDIETIEENKKIW